MKNMTFGIGAWLANLNFTRDISVAYIGVPLNVVVACLIGAFCSFSVGEKVVPRDRMWKLLVASVFMGGAFTVLVNLALSHWMEMKLLDGSQAAMATVVSFCTRFFLPWLADVITTGKWLKWIPWISRSKGE